MQEIPEDVDRLNEVEKRLTEYMGHWIEKELPVNFCQSITCLNNTYQELRFIQWLKNGM